MRKIRKISVTFRDELIENEQFQKQVSPVKVQSKEYTEDKDWQELAAMHLARYAELFAKNCVESINVEYFETNSHEN